MQKLFLKSWFAILLLISSPAWGTVDFDRVDDRVEFGASTDFCRNVGGCSVSAWINSDLNSGDDQVIMDIAKGDASSSRFEFNIISTGANDEIRLGGRSLDADGFQFVTTTTSPLTANTWHHVVGTMDFANDDIKIYVDGVNQGVTGTPNFGASTSSDTSPQFVSIGAQEAGVGDEFGGQITEVSVYNIELTQANVTTLHSGVKRTPLQVASSNLQTLVALDDGADGTANCFNGVAGFKDMSGNGNHGTGNDGTNNTGLICVNETRLTYP